MYVPKGGGWARRVSGRKYTWFSRLQSRFRSLWASRYGEVDGIVFVVDSADRMRIPVAAEELRALLGDEGVKTRGVPVLIMANKQDLDAALTAAEIMSAVDVAAVLTNPINVQCVCCVVMRREGLLGVNGLAACEGFVVERAV